MAKKFADFVKRCLLPVLKPFNYSNSHSVVIMDNASIHHVQEVADLIETRAGARVCFLPPYSPDLMPAEGVFSQVKSLLKQNHKLFQIIMFRPTCLLGFGIWNDHPRGLQWSHNKLWIHLILHHIHYTTIKSIIVNKPCVLCP